VSTDADRKGHPDPEGDRERASVSEARKTALAIAALGTLYLGSLQDISEEDAG
jgi:hypothetical protein